MPKLRRSRALRAAARCAMTPMRAHALVRAALLALPAPHSL
jgi:hypothetical protein